MIEKIKDIANGKKQKRIEELEARVEKLEKELQLASITRHENEKQRKEFSANVSHELKTPLTTILALSEMMVNGIANEGDIARFSGKINDQAKRLIAMIEDIISLSEFDEEEVARDFVGFNLYEVAEEVIEKLQEVAEERKVELILVGNKNFPICANKRLIEAVLYNLIGNAIKYNREFGHVKTTLIRDDTSYILKVSDNGIGIPSKHIERVFERFYRVDKSRSKKTGGTGLGLSIVKHIIEYHSGEIAIESEEGKGTTVICRIPKDLY